MKYIDEFRDAQVVQRLGQLLGGLVHKELTLMEVCGTHTMAIFRHGLKGLIPDDINLLSGPGCPVCVTPNYEIDEAIGYARQANIILATFGDMMKVPGSSSSLEAEKANGCAVRVVYSTSDALAIAQANPEKKVVFLGIGFETTAPTIAASVLAAERLGLKNYFVFCVHKIIPPALKALVDSPDLKLQGFLLPGHVGTIIGSKPYEFIVQDYGVGCVITGFEPTDIMQGIYMLAHQIVNGNPKVEIQYRRVVKAAGNPKALELMDKVFELTNSNWRGLGFIANSGLKLRQNYAQFDAEINLPVEVEPTKEHPGCICGAVLRGVKTPLDCGLFGKICTPATPVGACMVSSEGTCAAYYKYGGFF